MTMEHPPHATPELPPPPQPQADGWDLLDDYQTGKDVRADEGTVFRRVASSDQTSGEGPAAAGQTRSNPTRTLGRSDGSTEQDAEIMARIMGRQQERRDEGMGALERARTVQEQEERERRERIRERQRREIEDHLAMQRLRQDTIRAGETPLQQALREIADVFLALGICADHLEYLPEIGRFCSWGGKLYDHSQLFALCDARGQPAYVLGPSPHGPSTACYSPRERRWRLHHPVDPAAHITPVDRLLPIPRRHPDGSLRYSAQRPGTLLMEEGIVTVYVAGNGVYTVSQLQAAHVRHSGSSPLADVITAASSGSEPASSEATIPDSVAGRVVNALGNATDRMSSVISSTTRLFRRRS